MLFICWRWVFQHATCCHPLVYYHVFFYFLLSLADMLPWSGLRTGLTPPPELSCTILETKLTFKFFYPCGIYWDTVYCYMKTKRRNFHRKSPPALPSSCWQSPCTHLTSFWECYILLHIIVALINIAMKIPVTYTPIFFLSSLSHVCFHHSVTSRILGNKVKKPA